jgi:hypothetical protein
MKNSKEKNQVIMLAVVLALIGVVLLYFYHDKFLPKPVGDPVVLTPPQRLLIPPKSNTATTLYQQPDFQALRDHAGVPVKPQQLNGSGNPFLEDLKQ